jgi:hypothetical protein
MGQTTQQIASMISGAGAAAAPFTMGLSSLLSLAAGPIAGLINGCGQTCTYSSDLANQAEALLQQNLSAYLSIPVPHTQAEQEQAQENFNQVWAMLVQACSNPSLGSAGQNCIADRENGACDYQTSPGGWQQSSSGTWTYVNPGANGSGQTCWNWFVGYLDPIVDDPTVGTGAQLAAVSTQVAANSGSSVLSSSSTTWLLFAVGAGLILLLVI